MDLLAPIALIVLLALMAVLAVLVWRGRAAGANTEAAERRLMAVIEKVATAQAEAAGQIHQLSTASAAAQAELNRTLSDRLDQVSKRLGEGLAQSGETTAKSLGELATRLTVIDQAQTKIVELSSQVVGLQDILANKQARGAFGEVQLNDLVRNALPPTAYVFQATLSNGRRADCLIRLPNPPGPIVIDAKFPLESYHALRQAEKDAERAQAARAFTQALTKHIADIAERYIVAGETAESALMFLPAEAIYAELHASFPDVVERSYRARVWIVSPTTLMATLNTVRAVLKDARMREQAGVIQGQVHLLLRDVKLIEKRTRNLKKHFDQANGDVGDILTSSDRITSRAVRIEELEIADDAADADPAEIPPPVRN